ncbi:MAG: hypothetical protein B6229_07580 [Spirochaetaceae bacterium 4572_7]|nr:MAG: hypothetical protein B6229_07580 [Spirochaetaceae bacterium 4572_7]
MICSLGIKKYGSYQDFVWRKDDDKFKFNKLNIIYGHNYSGKTTLSRIFQTLEKRKQHIDYPEGDYNFTFENGTKFNACDINDFSIDYVVRVFNTDFVKDNLGWLHNRDGSILPFAILGSENVRIRDEIESLELILRNDEAKSGYEYKKIIAEKNKINNAKDYNDFRKAFDIENKMTSFAAGIRGNQKLYGRNPYNKTHLLRDFTNAEKATQLSEVERQSKLKQLDERELANIPFNALEYNSFETIISESINLLSRTIAVTDDLNKLVIDDLIKKWIIEGIEYHEGDTSKCKFCGSPFPPSRWTQLKNHFNDESKELRKDITILNSKLVLIVQQAEKQFNPKKTDFYISNQSDYLQLYEKWDKRRDEFVKRINDLVEVLHTKETKENDILNFDFDLSILNDLLDMEKDIELLIQRNNSKTTSLKKDKALIQKEILLSDIKVFLNESNYNANTRKLAILKAEKDLSIKEFNAIETKISETKKIIEAKKAMQKDESRGADRVNSYLELYFGSNDIRLEPIEREGLIQYEIKRNEVLAHNLSDGECSLISFCYFISRIDDLFYIPKETLEDGTVVELPIPSNEKLIIYIDDPISSLDNNHVFFIFSLIEARIAKQKKLKQLFVSTHNLDFLKYLKRLSGKKEECSYLCIEKYKKGADSKSSIVPMPYHLREYVTEFNYLFQEMYNMYKPVKGDKQKRAENSYTNIYSLPNNIRKFLELYTFYRYPTNDSLMKRLEMMFDGHVPILINRIANEFSHLTFIERAWKPFDIPELDEVVNQIFDKMKEIDEKQFTALLGSCK